MGRDLFLHLVLLHAILVHLGVLAHGVLLHHSVLVLAHGHLVHLGHAILLHRILVHATLGHGVLLHPILAHRILFHGVLRKGARGGESHATCKDDRKQLLHGNLPVRFEDKTARRQCTRLLSMIMPWGLAANQCGNSGLWQS